MLLTEPPNLAAILDTADLAEAGEMGVFVDSVVGLKGVATGFNPLAGVGAGDLSNMTAIPLLTITAFVTFAASLGLLSLLGGLIQLLSKFPLPPFFFVGLGLGDMALEDPPNLEAILDTADLAEGGERGDLSTPISSVWGP